MQYFRNYELANAHHVSQATVGKWVDAARKGKLDLTLHEHNGRFYIANTAKNGGAIEKLVSERRKYRNSRGFKTITPRPEFYNIYNQGQIYDIVLNLERYHEIPQEYNYMSDGAFNWDAYACRLAQEKTPNALNSTIKLLTNNYSYFDNLLARCNRINILDLGVGNALPVKDLIAYLLKKRVMGRYMAVDISRAMLGIAERNIREWFDGQVDFEGYELDFTCERFANILAQEYTSYDPNRTATLAFSFGGTLNNFRDPMLALKVVNSSMGINDFFVHVQKLDTDASRKYFDFNPEAGLSALAPIDQYIFNLLNIDPSLYDVEMGYDPEARQRYIRVCLKVALAINFEFEAGEYTIELNKGETILLWRAWQRNASDLLGLLEDSGFSWLHATQSADQEYILTVSRGKVR